MLHIGCGDVNAPGFINVDARRAPHVHFVLHDLHEIRFLPAASMRMVYMSHVLEHVPHMSVDSVLREALRVLQPGGVVRLSVPDYDLLHSAYQQCGDLDAIVPALMGGQNYPTNYHYVAFNRASLTRRLQQAGFEQVREWDPNRCEHHDFVDWANRLMPIGEREFPVSLNLEAVRR